MSRTSHILIPFLFIVFINVCFAKPKAEIRGLVVNADSREAVSNVNIYIKNSYIGTTSDEDGYYHIKLPTGKHILQFYHVIYEKKEISIEIIADSVYTFNIKLQEIVEQLGAITVEGERKLEASNYIINEYSAKNMPALAEPDVMRVVAFLPGVVQYSDYNTGLNIRGGWNDQNKIIYNDIEVHNPYHLYGLISAFNLWTVEDVKVWTANFPGEYEGKLSGVVSMKSKLPTSKPFTKLNLSLITINFALSRKYGDTFILFAVRRSYLDLILALMSEKKMTVGMYDVNFNVDHKFSEKFSANFTTFISNDYSSSVNNDENEDVMHFGNKAAAINLKYNNQKLVFSLSRNYVEAKASTYIDNYFDDYNLKYNYKLSFARHIHTFGLNFQALRSLYDWNMGDLNPDDNHFFNNAPNTFYGSFSLDNYSIWFDSKFYPLNTIQFGLKGRIYFNNKFFIAPAVSLDWSPYSILRFNINAGRNYQFFATGEADFNFVVAGNPFYILKKPMSADIYSMGSKINLSAGHNLSIEVYYKQYNYLVNLANDMENYPRFNWGLGRAYGMEAFYEKVSGRITYQLNYSYLNTLYNFQNKDYEPLWNIPHTVKGLLGVRLGKTWKFNVSFIYRSGPLYNKAIGYYKAPGYFNSDSEAGKYDIGLLSEHLVFDARHLRYDPYWRFDVSLRKKYRNKYFDWELYIQVLNITFNGNAIEVYSKQYAYDNIMHGKPQDSAYFPGFPILPTVGAEFTF